MEKIKSNNHHILAIYTIENSYINSLECQDGI
jgi:hypothetical protein